MKVEILDRDVLSREEYITKVKYATKRARDLKAAGKCVSCMIPVINGMRQCADCRQKRHVYRANRKKEGLCVDCPRKVTNGNAHCPACTLRDVEVKREKYRKGLCISCGSSSLVTSIHCELHNITPAKRLAKLTIEAKAKGFCVHCKKVPADKSLTVCWTCYLYKYRITKSIYDALLNTQNNVCASCKEPFDITKRALTAVIDHDHSTGVIRGILHHSCNSAYGLLSESLKKIHGLSEYHQKHTINAA